MTRWNGELEITTVETEGELNAVTTQVDHPLLAWSPEGATLALAGASLSLWSVDLKRLWERDRDGRATSGLAFNPYGTLIAQASGDLRLFSTKDGALVRRFADRTDDVCSVAFSPDGTLVAAGLWTETRGDVAVRVWWVATGAPLRSWTAEPPVGRKARHATAVAFMPDGASIVIADHTKLRLLRLTSR